MNTEYCKKCGTPLLENGVCRPCCSEQRRETEKGNETILVIKAALLKAFNRIKEQKPDGDFTLEEVVEAIQPNTFNYESPNGISSHEIALRTANFLKRNGHV